MKCEKNATAIVKWAGGKGKLASIIEGVILEHINLEKIDTYVEPFIGGGSFFFYMAQKYKFKNKIISDINGELINLYKVVKEKPNELIHQAGKLQIEYNNLKDIDTKSEYFYDVRNRYNQCIAEGKTDNLNVELAVDFLFLNKIGFNGLYRVNSKGLYNVPFGKREKATLFNERNIETVSKILEDTEIIHRDYQNTIDFANENSLFYFDPPYRPLSTSSSFTNYAKSSFNDTNQKELAEFCNKISVLGSEFALSNSDPKNSNADDDFFDLLYKNYHIERIYAQRMIGAKTASRGKVSEILVVSSLKR